jgi:hypothetical protein
MSKFQIMSQTNTKKKIDAMCKISNLIYNLSDHLCGLVVKIPGYRSRGPGVDSRRYHIFWEVVGLERGLLSPLRITEEQP